MGEEQSSLSIGSIRTAVESLKKANVPSGNFYGVSVVQTLAPILVYRDTPQWLDKISKEIQDEVVRRYGRR